MPRPQAAVTVFGGPDSTNRCAPAFSENKRFDGHGRVLVRPSGTEPVIRVLAEAETAPEAEEACGTISALVRRELG